ncbi:MAG: hypothetical protein JNM63_04840, partial [Spirochaetia bacterium]|nr:hypothetical protein [Spirochaetia bacterium]
MTLRLFAVCLTLLFADLSAEGSPNLSEGLLFYLDFNQGLRPRTATGGSDVLAAFKPAKGVFGEALEASEPVVIPLIKNLEPKKGAVSFHIRPSADLGSVATDLALFDGTEHIRLRWLGKTKTLCFMTGATLPEVGFRWQYGSVTAGREWKSGEWHQVVLQWDAALGTKSLWIDGRSVYETKTEFINPGYTGNKTMSLGQKNLTLAFDEFCVWNRNLSSEEVAVLFKQGLGNVKLAPLTSRKNEKPPLRIDPVSWRANPSSVILRKGETISLPVRLSNRSGENFSSDLTFRLVDLWGNELGAKTVSVRLAKSAFTQIEIPWTAGEDGSYKCVTRLAGEATNFDLDCGSFAVLDRAASPSNRDSFFGHHVNSWDKGVWLDQAARLGMSWMRGHNMLQSTWWIRVQPEPGAFQFAKQAEGFDFNAERGMSVLGQFFGVPAWAAQNEDARESATRYPNGWV